MVGDEKEKLDRRATGWESGGKQTGRSPHSAMPPTVLHSYISPLKLQGPRREKMMVRLVLQWVGVGPEGKIQGLRSQKGRCSPADRGRTQETTSLPCSSPPRAETQHPERTAATFFRPSICEHPVTCRFSCKTAMLAQRIC